MTLLAFGHFVRRFDEHRVAKRIREYRGLPPKDAALLTGKVSTKAKLKLSDEHRVGDSCTGAQLPVPASGSSPLVACTDCVRVHTRRLSSERGSASRSR